MLGFLWCTGCDNREPEATMFAQSEAESLQKSKKPPLVLDEKRKTILNAYQQDHIISNFSSMTEEEKEVLLKRLELIHFDFVDLVFHNLVRKSAMNTPRASINGNHKFNSIREVDILKDIPTREDFEGTLKIVSQGKLALVVTAGLSRKFGYDTAKLRIKPNWDSDFSLLQLIVERAREIGSTAIYRFGKSYTRKREPIQIYLMINTSEIEDVKSYLESVKNFGYTGLLTFGQDVLPYIDDQGRMCFEEGSRSRIRLVTNGSGAFLSALKSQNLIDHMKKSGIDTVQMINLNNLMVPLVDSSMVMASQSSDIVIQVSEHNSDCDEQFPLILYDESTQHYEYFNQLEVDKYLKNQPPQKIDYELKTFNLYTTIKFLEKASKSAEVLCHYRIKDQIYKEKLFPNKSGEKVVSVFEMENHYSFELHFLNVLSIASSVKFQVIPKHLEAVALYRQDYSPFNKFTLKEAVIRLFKNIPEAVNNWIPYEYQKKLETISRHDKLKLFAVAGFGFNETSFKKFIDELEKK